MEDKNNSLFGQLRAPSASAALDKAANMVPARPLSSVAARTSDKSKSNTDGGPSKSNTDGGPSKSNTDGGPSKSNIDEIMRVATIQVATTIIKDPSLSDVEVLNKLRALVQRQPTARAPAPAPGARERSRIADVKQELKIVAARAIRANEFRYLDVGCSEGKITAAVAAALFLPRESVFACDVEATRAVEGARSHRRQSTDDQFTFVQNEPTRLPFESDSFDFVTMFMSAHHFSDVRAMFGEVSRVMRPGGYVLLREHDCNSREQALFYDAAHAIYACVLSDEITPDAFIKSYATGTYAHYRNIAAWNALAKEYGLIPLRRPKQVRDRFDSFYAFYAVKK